jgi:tartrate-resistant acid phosphatase type 5
MTVAIVAPLAHADDDSQPDCFLSMGDWGHNNEHVTKMALHMDNMSTKPELFGCRTILFVFALGDNFYETGVRNVTDPQWNTTYRNQFRNETRTPALAGLPFYAVAGNHDYGTDKTEVHPEYVDAQIAYSKEVDKLWHFPDTNYTLEFSMSGLRVRFVLMNTEAMHLCADGRDICFQQDQPTWVDDTLTMADDNRSIELMAAVGHHNVFSPLGGHVDPQYDTLLSPILERHRVSFALFGHSHFAAWGRNGRVHNDTTTNDFPGSLWYITNGAARGSDSNNCTWADDTPLLETFCAPQVHNEEGAFMLHRVINGKAGGGDSVVEHCLYGSESGVLVTCATTPFRSLQRRSPPDDADTPLSSKWIAVVAGCGGTVICLLCVVLVRMYQQRRYRRHVHSEAESLCAAGAVFVEVAVSPPASIITTKVAVATPRGSTLLDI